MVLFSRSSKTIVLLELTVPPEDNVHLAHDRKTSKYSALVTACEENGFKTHMFALEVGCLGYCPHSFLHCFEALGLPKSAARQIRSEASKTALRSSYVLFLRRGMPTWECQLSCSLLNPAHVVSYFHFFLSSFALPFPFPTVRTPRQLVPFPSIHATPSLFDFSNCQTYTVLNAYSSFSRASFRNKLSSSQSVALCLFFVIRGLNDACADRPLVDLFF